MFNINEGYVSLQAGAELGLWLFGGYILQALGLETTTAAHGSFTGTIMVLIVPVLVGLSGRKVANSTWIGALVALFGESFELLFHPFN